MQVRAVGTSGSDERSQPTFHCRLSTSNLRLLASHLSETLTREGDELGGEMNYERWA